MRTLELLTIAEMVAERRLRNATRRYVARERLYHARLYIQMRYQLEHGYGVDYERIAFARQRSEAQ